jgi:hypothetical protein
LDAPLTEAVVPNILISYRRADSDAIAGRIRDRVAGHFGDDCVFMDIDNIPFGLDFRTQVQDALAKNDIVLAIIGPKWMGGARSGSSRILDEADPVRVEIETALTHGIPVVPVLVGAATMPRAADLPEGLKDLPYLNAAEVSAGRDFNQHIERLLRSIEQLLKLKQTQPMAPKSSEQDAAAVVIPKTPEQKLSRFQHLMARNGLLFEDRMLERAFIDSFRQRFYVVGQTSMMFGILAWVVFGATDLLSGVGGLESIQFRFMLAMPLMLLFFGLSFTQLARQHWQPFFASFAVAGITCMYIALLLVGPETWFRAEQATMSFMLFIALVGMAPFTAVYAAGVGLFIMALHVFYVALYPELSRVHALFYTLFVAASYLIICTTAWVRERSLRSSFVAQVASDQRR